MSPRIVRSPDEVADIIDGLIAGTDSIYVWDDFISQEIRDNKLDKIRELCNAVDVAFPRDRMDRICNEDGIQVLRQVSAELRKWTV